MHCKDTEVYKLIFPDFFFPRSWLKNSVRFKVKLTRTINNSIIVKSFFDIFGHLFVKLFLNLFKCLLIRTSNHSDFVKSY